MNRSTEILVRLVAALLLALSPFVASAASLQPSEASVRADKTELEQLNARWLKSFQMQDPTALEEILHENFIGIYGTRTLSKSDLMASAANKARKITQISWDDLSINVSGDIAVVTAVSSLTGTQDGRDISARNRYADVYVRTGGRWKAIAAHVIRVEQ